MSEATRDLRGIDAKRLLTEAESDTSGIKRIGKTQLVNTLNFMHFTDTPAFVCLRHKKYGSIINAAAIPQPVANESASLLWCGKDQPSDWFHAYDPVDILLDTGQELISVKPVLARMSLKGVYLDISGSHGLEVTARKMHRHACKNIQAELVQNSLAFGGTLTEYNSFSFAVFLPRQGLSLQYLNAQFNATVLFKRDGIMLYSGECRIIRETDSAKGKTVVLEPVSGAQSRFKPKNIRSSRHNLFPTPNVFFKHPFTDKAIYLDIDEISGSGFSVIESYESPTLLPGLIIPELEIEFAYGSKITCKVQVITQSIVAVESFFEDKSKQVKSGIAILDMDAHAQITLSSILHQATNRKSYVCNRVDLDALWRFFFKAGFIYPKKYSSIQQNIESFKETYRKLYLERPEIARHFIYQDNGEIHAHLSMILYNENTWLFHHHAATASASSNRAGLVVFNQIGRYTNDVYNMPSANLHYIQLYFRPENKFPNRVFGGYAEHLNDKAGCSVDSLAYLHIGKDQLFAQVKPPYVLEQTTEEDIQELENFYAHASGGLMLEALELRIGEFSLTEKYKKLGMRRERYCYSLRSGNELKAIFIVNTSDVGLNMSSLTSCVTACVFDEKLPLDAFMSASSSVAQHYEESEVPFLVFPVSYAEQRLQSERTYKLWTFNTQYTDNYLHYTSQLLNRHREKKENPADEFKKKISEQ